MNPESHQSNPAKLKLIGFVGSPHKNGNTAWIVNQILKGAKQQGVQTQIYCFSDLDIKLCRGCLCCHNNGDRACVVNDDMQKLYAAIEDADAVVFGSPIYMGQMSGHAKTFTDRLFAAISPRFSPHYKQKALKKKLVLTFNQGNPDPGLFQPYIDYTKHMFEMLEFDVKEVPVVTGMRNGPAHERKGLDTALKEIGSSVVLELHSTRLAT